jgi:hypothetical protein
MGIFHSAHVESGAGILDTADGSTVELARSYLLRSWSYSVKAHGNDDKNTC